MTLAITYAANDGEPADLLEVTETADPPPPGPGQVQVDVRAFPLHPGDLYLVPPAPGRRAERGPRPTTRRAVPRRAGRIDRKRRMGRTGSCHRPSTPHLRGSGSGRRQGGSRPHIATGARRDAHRVRDARTREHPAAPLGAYRR